MGFTLTLCLVRKKERTWLMLDYILDPPMFIG